MDKADFSATMMELSGAYNKRFLVDDDVLRAWFKYFKEFEAEHFASAAEEWIYANVKPPTIAELIKPCRRKRSEAKKWRNVGSRP